LLLGEASASPKCDWRFGLAGLEALAVGRFSKWLWADTEMAERESIRLEMTSGEAVWART
jgi:hypothetical protein